MSLLYALRFRNFPETLYFKFKKTSYLLFLREEKTFDRWFDINAVSPPTLAVIADDKDNFPERRRSRDIKPRVARVEEKHLRKAGELEREKV